MSTKGKVNYNSKRHSVWGNSTSGRMWKSAFMLFIGAVIIVVAVMHNSSPSIVDHGHEALSSDQAYLDANGNKTTDGEEIYLHCVVSSEAKGEALTANLAAQGITVTNPTSSNGHDQIDGFDVQVPDRSKIKEELMLITKIVNQTKPCD